MDIKSWQVCRSNLQQVCSSQVEASLQIATCSKPVDNLQQTCYNLRVSGCVPNWPIRLLKNRDKVAVDVVVGEVKSEPLYCSVLSHCRLIIFLLCIQFPGIYGRTVTKNFEPPSRSRGCSTRQVGCECIKLDPFLNVLAEKNVLFDSLIDSGPIRRDPACYLSSKKNFFLRANTPKKKFLRKWTLCESVANWENMSKF